MRTGTLSAREDREEMYESYKEMSWAVGVKKPQEAQKAKALQKQPRPERKIFTIRLGHLSEPSRSSLLRL